jgi:hypothetical protein
MPRPECTLRPSYCKYLRAENTDQEIRTREKQETPLRQCLRRVFLFSIS